MGWFCTYNLNESSLYLTSIKDEKFVKEMSEEADMIEQTTIAEEQKILDYVKTIF